MANNRVRLIIVQFVLAAFVALIGPWCIVRSDAQRVATADRVRETPRVTVDVDNAPFVAVLHDIANQAGLEPLFDKNIIPAARRVTLHVRDVAVAEAFQQALRGTGLRANIYEKGDVAILRDTGTMVLAGTVVGRVIDAKTKQPLRGAKVGINSVDRVVETANDGSYRIAGVSAGSHSMTVKLLGYIKVVRTVNVQDNSTTTIDIALETSVTPLDQVVVTGTVIPTELRAVPNAINVITARQIEERGITKIDQLFRGDIPGLFAPNTGSSALLDEVTMFSRGATTLSYGGDGISKDLATGISFFTNAIKTYVDGIELADPKYLSQIDPKSIERIEILTGPQASTIYGSKAINGVMNIFTKRGTTSHPQLSLSLLSGWVENNFSRARTPQHDYSAQLSGVEGRLSYNAGGSWNYMGPWTPAKQTTRTGGFGGARLDLPTPAGRVTADMTLRRSITQSITRGSLFQTATGYQETGWYTKDSYVGLDDPTAHSLTGQTLGLTLSYAPTSWWSQEVGIGQDASDAERRQTARGYAFGISDTTLLLVQSHIDRRSLRYTTTVRLPVTSFAQATVTAGTDSWQNLTSSMTVYSQTLTGSLIDAYGAPTISRQPDHNTGGFLQTQLGVQERLFFTYGLRAEWNPAFGDEAQPNYAPRYGVAYTQEVGSLTAKLRASYGRSTRPPQRLQKLAQTIAEWYGSSWASYYQPRFEPYYGGVFDIYLANSELAPEYQQGAEGGLELYFGTRASFVVTRYNQTVDELIATTIVDSVRSAVPCPEPNDVCFADSRDAEGYGYLRQFQSRNIASIRNQGWELQGSMNFGPITTRGTYSWTKSRTIGVMPKYRAFFTPDSYPQFQPGATFQFLPEHTWALEMTYARGSSSVGLNVTGTGQATNIQNDFYFQSLDSRIRLPQNKLNVSNAFRYTNFNSGYALADLTASHRFAPRVEGVLQVQNLADHYTADSYAAYASMGRQLKIGARVR
jgi:outer membrane receptor protein involved in Fe transport